MVQKGRSIDEATHHLLGYDAEQPPAYSDAEGHATSSEGRASSSRDDKRNQEFSKHQSVVAVPSWSFHCGDYVAEHTIDFATQDVVTHDRTLNASPAALSRFLKRASTHMDLRMNVKGTTQVLDAHNRPRHVRVDFAFAVPFDKEFYQGLGASAAPVFHVSHRTPPGYKQNASSTRARSEQQRTQQGVRLDDTDQEAQVALSSKDDETPSFTTARTYQSHAHHFVDADDVHAVDEQGRPASDARRRLEEEFDAEVARYCADPSPIKELVVTKDSYGYSFDSLAKAVLSVVQSTTYTGNVQITFEARSTRVVVRPDNIFLRAFSAELGIRTLLIIILIYPILCIIEMVFGKRYHNLRATFPLTRWRPLPPPPAGSASSSTTQSYYEDAEAARQVAAQLASRKPKVAVAPVRAEGGTVEMRDLYLVGTQEGEWLRSWEQAIVQAIREQRQGFYVLTEDDQASRTAPRAALRGYEEDDA